jgi:hypothetical protein
MDADCGNMAHGGEPRRPAAIPPVPARRAGLACRTVMRGRFQWIWSARRSGVT